MRELGEVYYLIWYDGSTDALAHARGRHGVNLLDWDVDELEADGGGADPIDARSDEMLQLLLRHRQRALAGLGPAYMAIYEDGNTDRVPNLGWRIVPGRDGEQMSLRLYGTLKRRRDADVAGGQDPSARLPVLNANVQLPPQEPNLRILTPAERALPPDQRPNLVLPPQAPPQAPPAAGPPGAGPPRPPRRIVLGPGT